MKKISVWLALGFLWGWGLPSAARATELEGLSFPDQIQVEGTTLVLNGLGLRKKTVFQVNVYVAALYLKKPSTKDEEILNSMDVKQVDVVFLRDVTTSDVNTSWDEGFQKNCKTGCPDLTMRLTRLKACTVDLKKGQKVSFVFYPEQLKLLMGGKTEIIPGGDFAKIVLASFIGDPPSLEVKRGMLGLLPAATDRKPAAYTEP